jgi:hypothetical protein
MENSALPGLHHNHACKRGCRACFQVLLQQGLRRFKCCCRNAWVRQAAHWLGLPAP